METTQFCRQCGHPVAFHDAEAFDRMHFVCFHFEREHPHGAVALGCAIDPCPAADVALQRQLTDWTGWDQAARELGSSLGIVPSSVLAVDATDPSQLPREDVLEDLRLTILTLAHAGVLERRDDPAPSFRWRPSEM